MRNPIASLGLIVLLASAAQAQIPSTQAIGVAPTPGAPPGPIPDPQTLISIRVAGAPASEVMRMLGQMSGTNVGVVNEGMWRDVPDITYEAEKRPFWIVMQELFLRTGLNLQTVGGTGDGRAIVLTSTRPMRRARPQSQQGAFLFVLDSATRSKVIAFSQSDQPSSEMNLEIRGFLDPQIRVLDFSRLSIIEAIDNKGNVMGPSLQIMGDVFLVPGGTSGMFEYHVGLTCPTDPGASFNFKALARFHIAREDVWTLGDVTKIPGSQHDIPGGKYTIKELARDPSNPIQVTLRIVIQGEGANGPLATPAKLRQGLTIRDADGKALRPAPALPGSSRSDPGVRQVDLTYLLNGSAQGPVSLPASIEWRIPTDVTEVAVPVEFKDVPIP